MTFDGSAIKALLDDAVSRGAVRGIAAVVVDRNGPLFHHAAGEAGEHAMFRNALMTKAVATTVALQFVEARQRAGHAQQRHGRLGRRLQFLLLNRPLQGHRRRADDAAAALLRQACHRDTHWLRDGGVSAGGSGHTSGMTSARAWLTVMASCSRPGSGTPPRRRPTPRPISCRALRLRRSCRASSTTCRSGSEGIPRASPPTFPDGPAA